MAPKDPKEMEKAMLVIYQDLVDLIFPHLKAKGVPTDHAHLQYVGAALGLLGSKLAQSAGCQSPACLIAATTVLMKALADGEGSVQRAVESVTKSQGGDVPLFSNGQAVGKA